MDKTYPEDAIKSFLKIESTKIKDTIYYEINAQKNVISLYDPVHKKPSDKTANFEMDKIFTSENENSYIYEEICLNTIKDAIDGISYSFISYGETSSNKIDLLIGNLEDSYSNINHRGIYPRLLDNLFKKIKHKESKTKKLCLLISYFLVYDNNLVDLSNFRNTDLSNLTKNDLFNNAFIIKNETDIINKINKIKLEKTEDSLLFLNQILSTLIQLERNTNENIYSRSHICISLYLMNKNNDKSKNISTISFILLNGSEYLYSGRNNKLKTQSQNENNIKKALVDGAKYTLETQYTYETIYNCMKSVKCLNTFDIPGYRNDKKENTIFSNLTTVLYNICFGENIPKIKYRIIGTILPNTGFYPSVKDTLLFLFDCRNIMKRKKYVNFEENLAKMENPSEILGQKKDDYIFQLENKVKTQKRKIDELSKNIIKKDDKIVLLQKTYIEQINTVKKRLNFPGDINVLISGDEHTKEAKFVQEMKEYQDNIKRNEGNMHILEKKLKLANDEIAKLKNKNTIKNTDETMINYYLSVQKSKEEKNKDYITINNLYSQIEGLKKEIDIKNKINEQLKKEIEHKNNIIFNLPLSLKDAYTPSKLLSPKSMSRIMSKTNRNKEDITDEKNDLTKNENSNSNEGSNERDELSGSLPDNELYYNSQIKRLKANHKKNIEVLEVKYKNLLNDKEKESDELKSYLNKRNDFDKNQIELYKRELIKYNEVFMQLISNYRRIFFSKLTPQCNLITLKNKKEEFDSIILNIDKEINHLNFPLLFKELESKNLLNMNITGAISNMRKADLRAKKLKNITITEDKKVNEIKTLMKEEIPPPPIKNIQNVLKEATNEGKIVINKDTLNEMSKEAIVIHCLNLNKIVTDMEFYLEKYAKYKKGFNAEEFENNVNYKEKTINELNNKINKITSNLEEQIQLNYNNMTLIKTQNKIIDKLQKELLFHNMLKKSKKYLSTNYSNMNTNILINENSTSSTLIPSINNMNHNNYLLSGKKLKKSNSCFNLNENNKITPNNQKLLKTDKNQLNNGINGVNFISSIKNTNRHRIKRNMHKTNSSLSNDMNIKSSNNTFTNNNKRNIRPFSSTKKLSQNIQ